MSTEPVAKILTVSDGVAAGTREDRSGPAIRDLLVEAGFTVEEMRVVPDGADSVSDAIRNMAFRFRGLLVTTGGTGFGPRDHTPEGTQRMLDRPAPGLAEAMRAVNPLGRLSRGVAGIRSRCLVVNVAGSERGAVEMLGAVMDVLPHALELMTDSSAAHPVAAPGLPPGSSPETAV